MTERKRRPGAKNTAKAGPEPRAAARTVPTQARSRERYERILEAATIEFAQAGFVAATMEGIAQRAETSIGSVYRFFPDKRAVYEALVSKHLDGAKEIFELLFKEATSASARAPRWQDLIDKSVDAFAAFDRSGPLFRAIWTNIPHSGNALGDALAVNREFARRAEVLLERYTPGVTPERRALVAIMMVEAMTAALTYAAREEDQGMADAMVEETKVLLKRYLAPYTRKGAAEA